MAGRSSRRRAPRRLPGPLDYEGSDRSAPAVAVLHRDKLQRPATDGRRSPAEVLDQVTGRAFSDQELARIFAPLLTSRRVDQQGYVRFRNWRLYGERGLAGEPASIWVTDEEVTIQFAEEPLARYGITYQRDHRHFRQVTPKRVFETTYQSPQPLLLEFN